MLFKYKVNFWDTSDNKNRTETGLVVSKSCGEACEKVVEYYNLGVIYDITLEPWESFVTFDEILEGLKL